MVTVVHSASYTFKIDGSIGVLGEPTQNLTMTITGNHTIVKASKSHPISATPGDRIFTECNVTNYLKANTYMIIRKINQTQ